MSGTLTLNKITAQRGISVGEAAKKIADLGWNPSYVQEAMTFPTDYKITKAPKDPINISTCCAQVSSARRQSRLSSPNRPVEPTKKS